MSNADRLKILNAAVAIYRVGAKLLVLDKLFDCSYKINPNEIYSTLDMIFNNIDNEMKDFILTESIEMTMLAIPQEQNLTDWHKVPRLARKIAVKVFVE